MKTNGSGSQPRLGQAFNHPWEKINQLSLGYGLASIVFFLILIFSRLSHSPAPLFQDESDGLSRALHWANTGSTYGGEKFPILIHWTGQFYSFPSYFYPIAVWFKLFGGTVEHLRGFSAFSSGLTTFFTYALARLLGLKKAYAILASLLFISAPHTLLNYRIAWDPVTLTPLVLVAVLCIEQTLQDLRNRVATLPTPPTNLLRPLANVVVTGIGCGLLWWSYTPGRLIAVAMMAQFVWRLGATTRKSNLRWLFMGVSLLVFTLAVAPVLLSLANHPSALMRTRQELNQFTLLGIYASIKSLFSHLTYVDYLLFWGDPQRRHSTGYGGIIGMAGWIIIGVLVTAVYQRNTPQKHGETSELFRPNTGVLMAYLVICSLPGALSFPEFHSLRNIATIPFWCILASLLCQQLLAKQSETAPGLESLSLAALITIINLFGLGAYQYMVADNSFLAKAQQGPGYAKQSKNYFQYNEYLKYHSESDQEIIKAVKALSSSPSTGESRVIFEYYSRGLHRRHGSIRLRSGQEMPPG